MVTISFDPRETPALAAAKKKTYVDYLPEAKRANAHAGWHFLTADEDDIQAHYRRRRFSLSLGRSDKPVCARQRDLRGHAAGKTRALLLWD